MKYCSNCGHPMEDHARFCSNCGQKTVDQTEIKERAGGQQSDEWNYGENSFADVQDTSTTVDRKGMRIGCWVFAILGIVSMVMALTDDFSMMAMVAFCLPLAGMFYILSKTPKKSKYILGANSGIRKSFFVTFCIVLAFVLFMVLIDEYDVPESENSQTNQIEQIEEEEKTETDTTQKPESTTRPTPTATESPQQTSTPKPSETVDPEKFISEVKTAIAGAVGDGEKISDVTMEGQDLCVTVDLSNAKGPLSKEDLALSRVASITDEILELKEYYDLWDTITVDFGTLGKVVNDKNNIKDDGYGPYFDDTSFDLK